MVGKILGLAAQAAPWVVVSGLAYAAAFIKPSVEPLPLPQPLNEPRDLFYDVGKSTDDKFWFAGNNGLVLEGGREMGKWQRHVMSQPVNLQGIAVSDDGTVLAVGNAGWTFQRTVNGEWHPHQLPVSKIAGKLIEASWLDGYFWVIGEMGAIYRADANVSHWEDFSIKGDVALNDIARAENDDLWITAEFGTLYHSTDHGHSWSGQELGYESLRSVAFNGVKGVVVGNGGVIFHSDDSGANWTEVQSPTSEHLYDVINNGTEWLVTGNDGALLGSQDGVHWQQLEPTGFGGYHTRLLATNNGVLTAGQSIGLLSDGHWASWPDSLAGEH